MQQDKKSMMYKVFEATCTDPVKNDFVQTCKKYLEILNLNLSFVEIGQMSKWEIKKLVKDPLK